MYWRLEDGWSLGARCGSLLEIVGWDPGITALATRICGKFGLWGRAHLPFGHTAIYSTAPGCFCYLAPLHSITCLLWLPKYGADAEFEAFPVFVTGYTHGKLSPQSLGSRSDFARNRKNRESSTAYHPYLSEQAAPTDLCWLLHLSLLLQVATCKVCNAVRHTPRKW